MVGSGFQDRVRGALLGAAVGDALGMPVEGFSHQNVRTYYRGIKGFSDDERRHDLKAGQWTDDTQFTFALVRVLTEVGRIEEVPPRLAETYVNLIPEARRWGTTSRTAIERLAAGADWRRSGDDLEPTNGAPMRAVAPGLWWAVSGASTKEAFDHIIPVLRITHAHPIALTAGFGQAFAVSRVFGTNPDAFDRDGFWQGLVETVEWAETQLNQGTLPSGRSVTARLRLLSDHLNDIPLDLNELCDGAGFDADESWPFAVAMFARNPRLIEATLLSAINMGGDADTIGAMLGALLGACHGWSAFPDDWKYGLEERQRLLDEADAFAANLYRLAGREGAPAVQNSPMNETSVSSR